MARGALRGVAVAWLGLIVLQAASTSRGSSGAVGLLRDVDALLQRALDPNVPAIPDRRTGAGTSSSTPSTPGQRYGSADAADRQTTGRLPVPSTPN